MLDSGDGEADLLRRHRRQLAEERVRLDRLTALVDRTIEEMEGGRPMRPEELFDGFDAAKQKRYEEELVARYGQGVQAQIDESWRRVGRMSKADAAEIGAELADRDERFAALLDFGADPADAEVQALVAEHYRWVCRFWTPDADAFAGLGDLYVDHPEFRARYDEIRPGLAQFERDAMAVYAVESLA